jgi:hypothetical protein
MTLVVTLTACASDDDEPTSSTEDTPSSPSASQFVSDRHGYHLEVPAGWDVTEYGGTWTDFAQFSPGAEVPGEDVVSGPDSGAFLVSNSMVIPEGMSPDEWLAELEGLVGARTSPGCRGSTGTDVVAGEPARVIGQKCEDMHVVGRSLTHAGRGYYFTIGFPTGDSATEATLEGVVDSIGLD